MTLLPGHTADILDEIANERDAQDDRFGEQNHPDVNPLENADVTREHYKALADYWKTVNAYRVAHGQLAWDGILLEEAYEVVTEENPTALRTELIQVAAVAVAWIEAIDRRTPTEGTPQ